MKEEEIYKTIMMCIPGGPFTALERKFKNEMYEFTRDNIRHRRCICFVPSSETSAEVCKCGRPREKHLKNGKSVAGDWSPKTHTETFPANSFGTIDFKGNGFQNSNHAPYIRTEYIEEDSDQDMRSKTENLWHLMSRIWRVPPPKLIISVTGGATEFTLENNLKQSFKRGLVNAATSTDAWIVTGGTNAGVMQFVGEAVKEYKVTQGALEKNIVALGIAPWGVISNKDSLVEKKDSNGCFPAVYDVTHPENCKRGFSSLDPNHTHFILMDDGTEGKYGNETAFRARFEAHVAARKIICSQNNKNIPDIPVVSVVLEGGLGTLKTAMNAAKENTPVVVVKNSGRAADFIVFGYELLKRKGKSDIDDDWRKECRAKAQKMFHKRGEKDISIKFVNCLEELLERKDKVIVFSMDNSYDATNEIDQAILEAILKVNAPEVETQLDLSLAWNRCDVARHKILNSENRAKWKPTMNDERGKDRLFNALIHDKFDFVQLFIDKGAVLQDFLTTERLERLYTEAISKTIGPLSRLLENHLQTNSPHLANVGKLIRNLSDKQHEKVYIKGITRRKLSEMANTDVLEKKTEKKRKKFENPNKELFLWAVLLNRRELAQIFWRAGKDHIGGALMASSLLQSLAKKADKEVETSLSDDLMEHSQVYENHAIEVLSECNIKNKERTHELLTRKLETWGGITLYSMADSAAKMQFMGQPACQTKLNKIWRGCLALHTSWWKIVLCFFLPVFLPLIKFRAAKDVTAQSVKYAYNGNKANAEIKVGKQKHGHALIDIKYCCAEGEETGTLLWIKAILPFYRCPIVKFGFNTLMYAVFLLLFSYFVMVELSDLKDTNFMSKPFVVEIVIWIWVLTFMMEGLRQVWSNETRSKLQRVKWYIKNPWNMIEIAMYIMLLLSVILRFVLHGDTFEWVRMSYCITLICCYLRFLQTFFVFKQIGPKVVMIKRMTTDLMFFICILIVFILAYGVVAQALLYPNSKLTWQLLVDVIYLPYWQIYGEIFLEELQGNMDIETANGTISCQDSPKHPECPRRNILVFILFAIYMMMTNVLLLNLLIAMFSHTFNRVQERSKIVWQYYRYSLIYEYYDRPSLAPPFIAFNHIFRALQKLCFNCTSGKKFNEFRTDPNYTLNETLTLFERGGMENYLHRHMRERGRSENQMQPMNDRSHKDKDSAERHEFIEATLDSIQEQQSQQNRDQRYHQQQQIDRLEKLESALNKLTTAIDKQVCVPRQTNQPVSSQDVGVVITDNYDL